MSDDNMSVSSNANSDDNTSDHSDIASDDSASVDSNIASDQDMAEELDLASDEEMSVNSEIASADDDSDVKSETDSLQATYVSLWKKCNDLELPHQVEFKEKCVAHTLLGLSNLERVLSSHKIQGSATRRHLAFIGMLAYPL
jgi:hypothetical protein